MTPPLWYSILLAVALSVAAAGWAGLACWAVAELVRRGRPGEPAEQPRPRPRPAEAGQKNR